MTDTTHECPKPGCEVRVQFDRLACRDHWYEISKDTRNRVLSLWRRAPGSDRYFKARAQALLELGVPTAEIAEENAGVGVA